MIHKSASMARIFSENDAYALQKRYLRATYEMKSRKSGLMARISRFFTEHSRFWGLYGPSFANDLPEPTNRFTVQRTSCQSMPIPL